MVIRAFTRSHAPLEYSAGLPTHHHAWPSHHFLRNRRSRNLLGPRPPPTDRLSSDLSLYGGKNSNAEVTRLHAPEKKPATLFTRSSAAALFEAENTSFQSPKRQTDNHFGLLSDRFTIWRWNRLHRSLHAPPCAGKAPATCFTRAHAPNTCPRVPGTRLHATGTRQRQVSLHGFARSALNLQSSCHVAEEKKKKKKKRKIMKT